MEVWVLWVISTLLILGYCHFNREEEGIEFGLLMLMLSAGPILVTVVLLYYTLWLIGNITSSTRPVFKKRRR